MNPWRANHFLEKIFFRPDECSSLENTIDKKIRTIPSQNSRVPVHYIGTYRGRPGAPSKASYEQCEMYFSSPTFHAESHGRVEKTFLIRKKGPFRSKNLEFLDIFLENDMYTVFYQRKGE